ncbi:m-hydroxybenzyl alcohol hydroxylase [Penicillium longicatenatum]|nr:m-hydroxybenzyl alcohol hydroxylase [Penicillium longicatenatum]
MDRVLDRMEKTPLSESQLRFLGGVLMEGGSDTSSSLILTIIQAMTKLSAVQARAHAEIDRVVGSERSPAWSDFANMPYINCIIKEAHRWRPVSPLDATIVLNVWGIHHDPNIYPDPERFEPSRFESFPSLAPAYTATGEWDKRDHYGYGAGRRICPGIHLAERNLSIGAAKLLWAFEFTQPVGSYIDIDPESGTSQGFLHCPKEYGCGIRLRDPEKRETIERELREAQERFACFD